MMKEKDEIPVIFPSNAIDRPPRYLLDLTGRKLTYESRAESEASESGRRERLSDDDGYATRLAYAMAGDLSGSASASLIEWSSSSSSSSPPTASSESLNQAVITTSALVDEPSVLSVALSWQKYNKKGNDGDTTSKSAGSQIVEFKLPTATMSNTSTAFVQYSDPSLYEVAAIKAFPDGVESGRLVFKLVLVLKRGMVVTVRMDERLVPLPPSMTDLQVTDPRQYMSDSPVVMEQIVSPGSTSMLHHNLVGFVDSNRIVLALTPLLVTVHLPSGRGAIWSESQCRIDMESRAGYGTMVKGILSNVLFGEVSGKDTVDMPPTASLCVASTQKGRGENLLDMDSYASKTTLIFTIHSDGSLRKWKIVGTSDSINQDEFSVSSLLPLEVASMDKVAESFVPPKRWNESSDAVSLSARVYNLQRYGLAVSVQTKQDYMAGYDMNTDDDSGKSSDCHIWTVSGTTDDSDNARDIDCLSLQVPQYATKLVSMSWVPTEEQSVLSAAFESTGMANNGDKNRRNAADDQAVLWVTYSHSNMSIVGTHPRIDGILSLDQIAVKERDRIAALSFAETIYNECSMDHVTPDGDQEAGEGTTDVIDSALHQLDAQYIRFLFRPAFPRGNGTVAPPSSSCILKSLSKLVPRNRREYGMSIELETIKTMHEWRTRDNRKAAARKTSPLKQSRGLSNSRARSGMSLYEALVEGDESYDENTDPSSEALISRTGLDEGSREDDDNDDELDKKLSSELLSHERRWRSLLLQIWNEELVHRAPMCVFWLDSLPMEIVVRGGVTSFTRPKGLAVSVSAQTHGWQSALDGAAGSLIAKIESNSDKSSVLSSVEERMFALVASGDIVLAPTITFSDQLTFVGRWASSQLTYSSGQVDPREIVSQHSVEELISWAESVPSELIVSSGDLSNGVTTSSVTQSGAVTHANSQCRMSACSLVVRSVDKIRRCALSRCLLLLELASGSQAAQASLRFYLRSLSVLWTSAQQIHSTEKPIAQRFWPHGMSEGEDDSSTRKRLKFSIETVSILSPEEKKMTTVLDSLMIGASKKMPHLPLSSLATTMALAESLLDLAFPHDELRPSSSMISSFAMTPELRIIPGTTDPVLGHPKLTLRILSPYVAIIIDTDKPECIVSRKEKIAACLLSVASTPTNAVPPEKQLSMQQKASALLAPETANGRNIDVEREMIKVGLVWLEGARESGNPSEVNSITRSQTVRWLQNILGEKATATEIERVGALPTARLLFDSLSLSTTPPADQIPERERAGILKVAETLLRLSRLMNRLEILEKPFDTATWSDDTSYSSKILVRLISDTIKEMNTLFPEEFVMKMGECSGLYSKKFGCAVRARQWEEAYKACTSTPQDGHRDYNFKILVEKMVEAGSLDRLLDMCTIVDVDAIKSDSQNDPLLESRSVDFYEIASDVLLGLGESGDYYDRRATSPNTMPASDYSGALYSLHAYHGNWRRAAQALNFRYNVSRIALASSSSVGGRQSILSNELRKKLILEDMVLSSCGTAILIRLVKEKGDRFIMSGEYTPYTQLPSANEDIDSGHGYNDSSDRLSCFMTSDHLEDVAVQTISLRTLCFDRGIDLDLVSSGYLNQKVTNEWIELLLTNGYFHYGSLLGEAQCKAFQRLTGSRGIGGEDMFGQTLTHLLTNHIIPLTIPSSHSHGQSSRPTMNQLQRSVDTAGCYQENQSYVVAEKTYSLASLEGVATRRAASLLTEKLASAYSTSAIPVAEAVADSILGLSNHSSLPVWLERMLTGADVAQSFVGAGKAVFAPITKADFLGYNGNPQELLSLYINHGMLVEACDLVSSILDGFGSESANDAAVKISSRLPEKGDVDYVPYKAIDMLWNLVQLTTQQSSGVPQDSKDRLLAASSKMEKALTSYIQDSTTSEMGLRSARARARVVV